MTHTFTHPRHPELISASPAARAFTLIELSIVLIIVGLLVGGILVGSDLINQAKIRKIITEKDGYEAAWYTYRVKYNNWPGDHGRAETFFGAANTDNGNGDNEINGISGDGTPIDEVFLVWQHLELAGLIAGSYTGTNDSSGVWDISTGVNVPSSSYSDFSVYHILSPGVHGSYADADAMVASLNVSERQTLLMFGIEASPYAHGQTLHGLLPSIDTAALDRKSDDGLAISGQVRALHASAAYGNLGSTTGASGSQIYSGTEDPALFVFLMPK